MPQRASEQTGPPSPALSPVAAVVDVLEQPVELKPVIKKAKAYWHMLGPGLTTGASDDDPSGIGTYSQAGAQYGFGLLWLAAFTLPLMAIVQEMCARIGLVTGRGLAGVIRQEYARPVMYGVALLLLAANTFNIGADLGAMAQAARLLTPQASSWALVIGFGLFSCALQIITPYARYAKYLKWLALILFAYVASAIMAHLDWPAVLRGTLVPNFQLTKDTLLLICAILGTTISPYLFFWQTSQEIEEEILLGETSIVARQGTTKRELRRMRVDVWSGMAISNVTMFFIIAACGAVLFAHHITNITSAAQAAEALRPFAGNATYVLFALGIIGTGLLAIPVLAASSAYAISETFRWREGLYRTFSRARAFYGVIIVSMALGVALNFVGLDPIKALIYAAVLNGLVAPFVLFFIVRISSSQRIMGKWRNRPTITALGWLTVALMAVSGAAAMVALV